MQYETGTAAAKNPLNYYRTGAGREPVREWSKNWMKSIGVRWGNICCVRKTPEGFRASEQKAYGVAASMTNLKEEGIFDEAHTQAIEEVVAWRLAESMKVRKHRK